MNVVMNITPVSAEGNYFEQPPEQLVQVQHEPAPPELEQSLEPQSQTLEQPLASSPPEKVKKVSKRCKRLQKEKQELNKKIIQLEMQFKQSQQSLLLLLKESHIINICGS